MSLATVAAKGRGFFLGVTKTQASDRGDAYMIETDEGIQSPLARQSIETYRRLD
jgi:hypothetical protein